MVTRIRRLSWQQPFRTGSLGAVFVVLTTAAVWLWAHEGHEPLPTRGASVDFEKGLLVLSEEARFALDVKTVEVKLQTLEDRLTAPALLVAPWNNYAYATTRIAGKVAALHIQPGATVTQGQPLAEVESLELENLQLDLLQAQNEVQRTGQNLKELEASSESGSVSGQRLLEARALHQENQNSLKIARRKILGLGVPSQILDQLLTDPKTRPLRTLPIYSPLNGVVVHADIQVGQIVQPTDHLLDIVKLDTVWVQIAVLENDWPRIEVGQPLRVQLSAYPDEVFHAVVKGKGLAFDPQTHQGIIWAELANAASQPPRLLPGMYGQVELTLPTRKQSLTIPLNALIRTGAEFYVLVEEGPGQYIRRNVVVGLQSQGWVEIQSAQLVPGDRVVSVGGHELAALFEQGILRLSPEAAQTMHLRLETVKPVPVAEVIALSGNVDLQPDQRAIVSSRLPGILSRILVDRDQLVKAGDVIAEIKSLELHHLQLELLRNHLQVEVLGETRERLRQLNKQGNEALSQRQLRETESDFQAAVIRRESLQLKLEAIGLTTAQIQDIRAQRQFIEALPVRATIGGALVHFKAKLGQVVNTEEPLFEIHDLSRPSIRAYVSERQWPQVKIGQRVRVRLAAEAGFLADGVVVRSGQVFGSEDRTLSVWVELPDPAPRTLLYGMLARLTLVTTESAPTLAVSLSAIWQEGLRSYVFIRKPDGTFERRLVQTGRRDDRVVAILHGLNPGEEVAISGVAELQTAYASIK